MNYETIAEAFSTPLSKTTVSTNGVYIEEDSSYLSILHTPSYILVIDGVKAGKLHRSVSRTYPAHLNTFTFIAMLREDLEEMETKLQEKLEQACLTL